MNDAASNRVLELPPAAEDELARLLDDARLSSVAVVHGEGETAEWVFQQARLRRLGTSAVVWLKGAPPELRGPKAPAIAKLLAPDPRGMLCFFNVRHQVITGALEPDDVFWTRIDGELSQAESWDPAV